MPMIAFLPWATATESFQAGRFVVTPFNEALVTGVLPSDFADSAHAILETYGHKRPVDRLRVPLVGYHGRALTDLLTQEEVADVFAFRGRLAATSLCARNYFGFRYWNSESLSLVVQQFTVERAGSTTITTRRRDGTTSTIIPKGTRYFQRPLHVPYCALPEDGDVELLVGVEQFVAGRPKDAPALQDALESFLLGNTDSPDVHIGADLVHTIGALSSLVGEWSEKGLLREVARLIPAGDGSVEMPGPMAVHPRVVSRLDRRSIREVWLQDAYLLRGQYAHGRVHSPPYTAIWGLQAHLLLAAEVFALAVKGKLQQAGFYSYTEDDCVVIDALDNLCTLDPFNEVSESAPAARDRVPEENSEDEEDEVSSWRRTLDRYRMKRHWNKLEEQLRGVL